MLGRHPNHWVATDKHKVRGWSNFAAGEEDSELKKIESAVAEAVYDVGSMSKVERRKSMDGSYKDTCILYLIADLI